MPATSEKSTTVYVQSADWQALGYRTQTDYDADMAMRACFAADRKADEKAKESERSK